jgi:hypothetical protein
MILNETVTKKVLEKIVHETFSNLGSLYSSALLDSLKLLGFYYATNAGISINIEDLKTPDAKKEFLEAANNEVEEVSLLWKFGKVSDSERFQSIIDSWNVATESLKLRILEYFQDFDPANNLYIMAFSGARGNMSQVRQLVGMRGLMSDQEGKIIDFPIQQNFREGLSSTDYVISSYGARKGIVDTALKTADSGYLTRRLIYLAQDFIIREVNCKTNKGMLLFLTKSSEDQNFLGRYVLSVKELFFPYSEQFEKKEFLITEEALKKIKRKAPLQLQIRSPLTCQSLGSICQRCYGWDLAQKKPIRLGEAVGIIAAQSIGEPGTQLTMRTFHTGGIFTGETLKQITAPFSGRILFPPFFKRILFRTNHGILVSKLQQELKVNMLSWNGHLQEISLFIGSYLYVTESSFLRAGERIAEYSTHSLLLGKARFKPLYSSFSGEIIKCENLHLRRIPIKENRVLTLNVHEGVFWVGSGKLIPLPIETKLSFSSFLQKDSPVGKVKLITPFEGFVQFQENSILFLNQEKKILFDLASFFQEVGQSTWKCIPLVQNYQYVDKNTVLASFFIYPTEEGKIQQIRKKESPFLTTFFFITDSDTWKVNSDQINDYLSAPKENEILLPNFEKGKVSLFNSTSTLQRAGFFLKKDGFQMIFQDAAPIFLNPQTILNYKLGDFLLPKKVIGTLLNYTQQTEDIVQGLPKIEELIEARHAVKPCFLSREPGILFPSMFGKEVIPTLIRKKNMKSSLLFLCSVRKKKVKKDTPLSREGNLVALARSPKRKKSLALFQGKIYSSSFLSETLRPVRVYNSKGKLSLDLQNVDDEAYPQYRYGTGRWKYLTEKDEERMSEDLKNPPEKRTQEVNYENRRYDSYLVPLKNKKNIKKVLPFFRSSHFLFLQRFSPVTKYSLLLSKSILKPGNFLDIAEPLTEGMIDIHSLLAILFEYHSSFDGIQNGTKRCLTKFQIILVHSIQAIYQSQGVNISSKHIEIIVSQMTSKVLITESGNTPLIPGEYIRFSLMNQILMVSPKAIQWPTFEPKLLSATHSALNKDGFLSSAGFQETRRVLTKAAIEGNSDWLRGLKESIMVGRLVPAGTSFLNYKQNLDKIYTYQDSF